MHLIEIDTDGQIALEIGFDNIINNYNECSGIDSSGHPGHQDPGELGKDKTHLDYEHDPVLGKDTDGEITPKLDFDNIINSNNDCSDRDSSDSPGHQYPAKSGNDRTHIISFYTYFYLSHLFHYFALHLFTSSLYLFPIFMYFCFYFDFILVSFHFFILTIII